MTDPALRNVAGGSSRAPDLALRLLVIRCQTGDEAAFAKLMAMFEARTLGYLRGIVDDDADDVQQEVWLTVFRQLNDLADPGSFRTWLFRTTRHRAIDFLRKRRRERELIDDTPMESIASDVETGDDSTGAIDEATLAAALKAMPPPHREIVMLRYRDGLTYQEIAQVINRPIGTVRTRLHHAKRRLQESLTGRTT